MNGVLSGPRPMSAGEIINRAFGLYQENAMLFISILAITYVPVAIIELLIPSFGPIGGLINLYASGAIIIAIAHRYLGRSMTIGDAYSSVGVGTYVILLVATILVALAVVFGLILLIIPGIYLLVRFAFVQPAVVLERKGIGESFGRSSELVRGSWWRVFGIGLLVFVLFAIAGGVLTTVLSVAVSERVSVVVSALVNVLVEPFALGSLVLLYYDLRLRKEGTIGEPVGAVSSSPSF